MDLPTQLKRDEGDKRFPYTDTVGKVTIGCGFNLTDVGLYPEEIDWILGNRITKLRAQLAAYQWYSTLDAVRQAVVENMAYNMGVADLLHFPHMLAALAKQDWATAASEMANSAWAHQVGDRATRLEQQIFTGEWV